MKAPPQLNALQLGGDALGLGGVYPPLGFRPVWNAELGNGDYFGLYWPYGREDREPIVCDMYHDEWGLRIAFSSVPVFVEWLELNDHDRGDVEVDDPALPAVRFEQVRPLLRDEPEAAVLALRSICDDFPESAEYWFSLARQLRRIGDADGAVAAAVRSFASNWVFGRPPEGVLRMLRNAPPSNDPVVARCHDLSLSFGGTKENDTYGVLEECINEYLDSSTPVLGLLLNQNYGFQMSGETGSFQERYEFDRDEWLANHQQLCEVHLGDSRTRIDDEGKST